MAIFLSLKNGKTKRPLEKDQPFPKALSRPLPLFYKGRGKYFAKRCHTGKFFSQGEPPHFRRFGGMPRFFLIQREYLGPEPRPNQKARTYSNSHPKSKPATPLAKISPTSVHGPKSERSRQTNRTAGCPITIRKYRYKNSLGISSRYLL